MSFNDIENIIKNDSDETFLNYFYGELAISYDKKRNIINTEVDIYKNLMQFEKLSKNRKELILARLIKIEESMDRTTIFIGSATLYTLLLNVSMNIFEFGFPKEIVNGLTFFFYGFLFLMLATGLNKHKENRAKAKYLYQLISKR